MRVIALAVILAGCSAPSDTTVTSCPTQTYEKTGQRVVLKGAILDVHRCVGGLKRRKTTDYFRVEANEDNA